MRLRRHIGSAFILLAWLAAGLLAEDARAGTRIRYALGDVITTDDLQLLIAVERAKARGLEVEITAFKSEELATQAVINGQADVGQGTPYAAIQKLNVPVRFFYQLYSLLFFPVVSKEHYKSWKDLDGQEITVHARGSGTEAIVNLVAKQQGIKFKNISYVPGSQVRALGLLKGNIKATILDANNTNHVMKGAPGKFALLPLGELKASDEALFATKAFLDKNQAAVAVLVEELLRVSREINADPKSVAENRKKLGLLKDIPAKLEADITPYFEEAVKNGIIPNDGGFALAPKTDLEFFALSGALKGEKLKAEDFWELSFLKAALAKLGK
jgi:NitT/TauT family transport system substrate-binding protein